MKKIEEASATSLPMEVLVSTIKHSVGSHGPLNVLLTKRPEDIHEAQALRYKVFYEEFGATPGCEQTVLEKRDFDVYDGVCDHLVVKDMGCPQGQQVVATYRLIRRQAAQQCQGFYTAREFNIACLEKVSGEILELGRACVHKDYRSRGLMRYVWDALYGYSEMFHIRFMFGCASFPSLDLELLKQPLSYLYHYHLASGDLCPEVLAHGGLSMAQMPQESVNVPLAQRDLPPLIRGYMRMGCCVGNGAFVDRIFGTTDVCVVGDFSVIKKRFNPLKDAC